MPPSHSDPRPLCSGPSLLHFWIFFSSLLDYLPTSTIQSQVNQSSTMIMSIDSGATFSELESQLSHLLAVQPWMTLLTSLGSVPSSAYWGPKGANLCLKSIVLSYFTLLQCYPALGEGKKVEK